MSLKNSIKYASMNCLDHLRLQRRRHNEIKKFEDPRRKIIYENVDLSEQQKKEIDDLYLENYGEKIPYTWHRHFTAYHNHFDPYFFPELLYIPEFEYFMNYQSHYCTAISDKNFLPYIASAAHVQTADTVLKRTSGLLCAENGNVCSMNNAIELLNGFHEDLFIKPSVDSNSGKGCSVLRVKDGMDLITGTPLGTLLEKYGRNFVIQKRLSCHKSISDIYPDSVNTFRVITYRWKDEIIAMPAIMRIGQGGKNIDNAHAGGMFIGVREDGSLLDCAFTEFKQEFYEHPDTHLVFAQHKIQHFNGVVDSARKLHSFTPQIGCINWDFTIDEKGDPVLIEANVHGGSIWLIQMAHGVGCFGKQTPEILRWIRKMKGLKVQDRDKYAFGYNMN